MPAKWTEREYTAAGYRTVKLRLPRDVGEALDTLLDLTGERPTELISGLILRAYRKSSRVLKKDPNDA